MIALTPVFHAGSSPLARGLRDRARSRAAWRRIIPARAGFTGLVPVTYPGGRDHPRSRGVYVCSPRFRRLAMGSSPLARGLRRRRGRRTRARRIIPARAGFTPPTSRTARSTADHPRSRGVYSAFVVGDVAPVGSSPLARGLPRGRDPDLLLLGIIPARAGFTPGPRPGQLAAGDHPRSRGVYPGINTNHSPAAGSSPLARGLHTLTNEVAEQSLDHPRSRGVYPVWGIRLG